MPKSNAKYVEIAHKRGGERETDREKSQCCACSEYMLMFENISNEMLTHTICGYSSVARVCVCATESESF